MHISMINTFQILKQTGTTELLNYYRAPDAFYVVTALDIDPLLVLSEEKHIMPVFASNCFPVLSLANIEKIFSQISVNGEDGFMLSSLVANVFSEILRKR